MVFSIYVNPNYKSSIKFGGFDFSGTSEDKLSVLKTYSNETWAVYIRTIHVGSGKYGNSIVDIQDFRLA